MRSKKANVLRHETNEKKKEEKESETTDRRGKAKNCETPLETKFNEDRATSVREQFKY